MKVLRKILRNGIVQVITGVIMLISSFDGYQSGLWDDTLKLHHGLTAAGIWQVLQSIPNLHDSFTWITKGD